MTYDEFKDAVLEELGPDGTRRGIEALRTRAIKNAVIDLQRYIRAYRDGHTTTYQEVDLQEIGYSHIGALPAQAKPKALYIVSTGETVEEGTTDNPNIVRNRLDFVAWENRQGMIDGRWDARSYQYAISPFSLQFLVHPLVNDETYLLVVWDGLKMDFEDDDVVPWPEQAAEAVGCFVKSKILRTIDRRIDLAQAEWANYVAKRLALWREQNESQSADGKDEEYAVGTVPNPAPFANFGAQGIPFLATVTQLEGADTTALAAVPTTGIAAPYTVQVLIGGALETWVLTASTVANDPSNGALRPNDYAATTNEKVWVQNSI